MNKKEKITEIVFKNLPYDNPFKELSINQLVFLWWTTGRSSLGLRLSEEGKLAFDLAEIEFFDYPVKLTKDQQKNFNNKKFTLSLGKKIHCPFYIGLNSDKKKSVYIRIYDSKVAMMIALYGDIFSYLDGQ
jgi:hypothetical protein